MEFLATELTLSSNAELLGRILWFTAAVSGAFLAAALAGLAAEIFAAWTRSHRAPGAEFMGFDATRRQATRPGRKVEAGASTVSFQAPVWRTGRTL